MLANAFKPLSSSLELKQKTGSLWNDFARDEAATKGTLKPTSVTSVYGLCTIVTGIYEVVVNNYVGLGGRAKEKAEKCLTY